MIIEHRSFLGQQRLREPQPGRFGPILLGISCCCLICLLVKATSRAHLHPTCCAANDIRLSNSHQTKTVSQPPALTYVVAAYVVHSTQQRLFL